MPAKPRRSSQGSVDNTREGSSIRAPKTLDAADDTFSTTNIIITKHNGCRLVGTLVALREAVSGH